MQHKPIKINVNFQLAGTVGETDNIDALGENKYLNS